MHDENWVKWGVIALATVGALLLIALAINADDGLDGTSWFVDELVVDGSATAPVEGSTITATFKDDGVAGIASCNNYFGSYSVDGDEITFGPIGTTLMACIPEYAAQETAYLAALEAANRYEVDGDSLTLFDGDTVLVRYERIRAEAL